MRRDFALRIALRVADRLDNGWGDPRCRACGGAGSVPVKGERAHRRCACADRVDEAFTVLGNPSERELSALARRAS